MHNSYDYVWNPYACKNTNYNIVSLGFVQKKQKKTEARYTRHDVVAVTRDPLLVSIEIFQFLC